MPLSLPVLTSVPASASLLVGISGGSLAGAGGVVRKLYNGLPGKRMGCKVTKQQNRLAEIKHEA